MKCDVTQVMRSLRGSGRRVRSGGAGGAAARGRAGAFVGEYLGTFVRQVINSFSRADERHMLARRFRRAILPLGFGLIAVPTDSPVAGLAWVRKCADLRGSVDGWSRRNPGELSGQIGEGFARAAPC